MNSHRQIRIKRNPRLIPLPRRASTQFDRCHRTANAAVAKNASLVIDGNAKEESSLPRGVARFGKARIRDPASAASRSSSQSPECCSRAQGEGWSDINNSTSVRRALNHASVLVCTFIFGSHGRMHEAA